MPYNSYFKCSFCGNSIDNEEIKDCSNCFLSLGIPGMIIYEFDECREKFSFNKKVKYTLISYWRRLIIVNSCINSN